FTYLYNLGILTVTPVNAAAGTQVTVLGTGFQTGATVTVGGVSVYAVVASLVQLTFVMPSIPNGTTVVCNAQVVVNNPSGQSASMGGLNPAPVISQVVFPSGPAAGSSVCMIMGVLLDGASVTVGGLPPTILNQTATGIVFTTPGGPIGPAVIQVTNPTTGCNSTATYTYQ
ncbi:MAG: hypothetical protein EXS14_09640, partial [Planctomycetes bacterium]|nr:hypothetical protein [Planctomycetota bacterium]